MARAERSDRDSLVLRARERQDGTMNALHSLLKMVVAQEADELRLGVERAPLVLRRRPQKT